MSSRVIILALVVATSSCSDDDESCLIEDRLAALADTDATNCGVVAADADDAEFNAAHDCVATALANQQTFKVQWDLQGIDSRVSRALIGKAAGPGLQFQLLSFDGDPGGGGGVGNPHTTTFLCSNLIDEGQCGDMRTSLCFDCVNSSITDECP